MSEFDFDALLAGAVDDYQRNTLPQIKPAGTAVARATATHRRRVHLAAVSAVALVVIAAPIAAYAATDHDHNGPPNVASSQSASPEPSGSPSASPSATPSSTAPTLAPITQQDLANATLDLPSWGGGLCPSGTVKLHNGQLGATSAVAISTMVKAAAVDLDQDGSADAVAIFQCPIGNPEIYEAVGFHRAADGSIHTLGSVAADIHTIKDVRAGDGGTVQLQVSNLAGTDGSATVAQAIQWRTYEWAGTRFNQSGGPTSFTVSIPGLTATVSDLVYAAAVNGTRTGTMTVSLHNGGTATVSDASIVYVLGNLTSPKCDPVAGISSSGRCQLQPIAPGATTVLTFTFSGSASELDYYKGQPADLISTGDDGLDVFVGDQALAVQPKLGRLIVR